VAMLVVRGVPPSEVFAAVAEEMAGWLHSGNAFVSRLDLKCDKQAHETMARSSAWPTGFPGRPRGPSAGARAHAKPVSRSRSARTRAELAALLRGQPRWRMRALS
jgi:hypothetical protein